ncbi:MAG: hypothetical protein V1791_08730 [Pseudomonadota bacterium]
MISHVIRKNTPLRAITSNAIDEVSSPKKKVSPLSLERCAAAGQ